MNDRVTVMKKEPVKFIPLGENTIEEFVRADEINKPRTMAERLDALEDQIFNLTDCVSRVLVLLKDVMNNDRPKKPIQKKTEEPIKRVENMNHIPEGTVFSGISRGLNYFCTVKNGTFVVGAKSYPSLSAAAKGVSGVRRSGWTFWHLPDGRTAKEVFKK